MRAYRRKWYANNKKKQLDTKNKRKTEMKEWFNDFKSTLKCEACPENHPATLDFHHNDPNQKDGNVSHLVHFGYSKETILEEISKCKILCSNCHRKFHYNE